MVANDAMGFPEPVRSDRMVGGEHTTLGGEHPAGTLSQWADRMPATVVDGGLAVAMLAAMVVFRVATPPHLGARLPLDLALTAVIAGSLAVRRRMPLAGYVTGTAGLVVESLWVTPGDLTPLANVIGLYSLGRYATRRRAWLGLLVVVPGVLAFFAPKNGASAPAQAGVLFVWFLAWVGGYRAARRRERMEAVRRLMRRAAINDERLRIARELHDVIGNTVNAMLVQAGAGRMVLDTDPERARALFASVERTGRDALDELDRALGILRFDGSVEDQPGLADLERVVQPMADAGLQVHVAIGQELPQLPRSLDASAYRIVQEALTNALRHGRARTADVVIRVDANVLLIDVRDDGRGPAPGYQPGRGLVGVVERVAAFGGAVQHGRGPEAGFDLHVSLPLP